MAQAAGDHQDGVAVGVAGVRVEAPVEVEKGALDVALLDRLQQLAEGLALDGLSGQ